MSTETAYPVRKALGFTAEQWQRVRSFRFDHQFGTEAEAVRRLIDLGLEASRRELLPARDAPSPEEAILPGAERRAS